MSRTLRSTPITGLQHYYDAVRHSCPHRYFRPLLLRGLYLFPWHRATASPVPWPSQCKVRAAYTPVAGQPVVRFPLPLSRSWGEKSVSTTSFPFRRFIGRFTFVRLPCTHVTPSRGLFPIVHHRGISSQAALGRLAAAPECRRRRAKPPSQPQFSKNHLSRSSFQDTTPQRGRLSVAGCGSVRPRCTPKQAHRRCRLQRHHMTKILLGVPVRHDLQ